MWQIETFYSTLEEYSSKAHKEQEVTSTSYNSSKQYTQLNQNPRSPGMAFKRTDTTHFTSIGRVK